MNKPEHEKEQEQGHTEVIGQHVVALISKLETHIENQEVRLELEQSLKHSGSEILRWTNHQLWQ